MEFGEDARWHYLGKMVWRLNLQVYSAEVVDLGNGWWHAKTFGPPRGQELAAKRQATFLQAKEWAEIWIKAADVELRLQLAAEDDT